MGQEYSEAFEVRTIHTLGPAGTNCEAAAGEWARRKNIVTDIKVYSTLEKAIKDGIKSRHDALLTCVVYPDLHNLVFSNMERLRLLECFVMPTFNMVLASNNTCTYRSVACHPAPHKLVERSGLHGTKVLLVDSNTAASEACSKGVTDLCITTDVSAKRHNLNIIQDHGPIDMGFCIHVPV
jgi:prephenate dehydratase